MGTDGPGGPLAAEGAPADPPIDLRRMREAVRRNGALVAGAVLAVMGVVFIASLRAPDRFSATARIAGDGAALGAADASTVATGLATNRELVSAPAVLQAAARGLPGESATTLAGTVSASVEPDASILDVTATAGEPRRAARIANAVAVSFLASRESDRRAAASSARATLTKQLRRVRGTTAPGTLATALRERISDLALQEATAGSDLRLAEAATPPTRPTAPRPLRSALLAGLAALLLAVTAAVIRDRSRRRGADAAELAARAGIPLVAVLPRRRRRRGRKSDERLVVEQAALQGAVRAALPAKSQRVLVVCDIAGGEGAGWVAEGLARSLTWARQDAAVVRAADAPDLDAELKRERQEGRRYVIVVGPPVTGSALLPLLACHAAAAILVGRLDRTSAGEVATATQLLSALDMHPLGLVLTASPADAAAMRERGFEAAAPPPRRVRRDASRNGEASEHWPREPAPDGDGDRSPRQIVG